MDKAAIKERQEHLLNLVAGFCAERLNEEYLELAEKLIRKLGRKREVPFMRGKPEIWAAAVIHAVGGINFLFDKSTEPYVSIDTINEFFGTSKSTTSQKASLIRDLLKMRHWDDEFSTKAMKDSNPFAQMVMLDDMIVPVSMLPEDLQEKVRKVRAEGGDISFRTKPL